MEISQQKSQKHHYGFKNTSNFQSLWTRSSAASILIIASNEKPKPKLKQKKQMAQPGQMPIYPQIQMPPTILKPIPGSEPAQLPGMKRRREDEFPPIQIGPEPQDSAPKRRAKAQDVIFRIVVPSRQIGKVIGKEGCRIQKIREETKATIKIADAIAVCNSLFHSQGFV